MSALQALREGKQYLALQAHAEESTEERAWVKTVPLARQPELFFDCDLRSHDALLDLRLLLTKLSGKSRVLFTDFLEIF